MVTTYFLNLMLGNVFHTPGITPLPSPYYVGLSTTIPTGDGDGITEPNSGAYARAPMASLGMPVDGVITNAEDVEFSETTGPWGLVKAFFVSDQPTGGHVLMYDELINPQDIVTDNQARFRAGALRITARNAT